MRKLLICLLLMVCSVAQAQFTPGQLLTASALNAQFALYAPLAGATFTGSVAANAGLTASAITGTPISGSSGSFTTLSASSTVTLPSGSLTLSELATQAANTIVANGTGSTASPTAISIPSCSTSSSGLQWTSGTGFACNTSINAATLGGATFAAPGPVGSTTPSTGAFTTLSASSTVSGSGFSTYLAAPPSIGGTTANSGKFTTLQATSTITPSTTSGVVGTTLGDNANAGSIGEYVTANASGVSLTTTTTANITSISLTAGDWDVSGTVLFSISGGGTLTLQYGGISTTSATLGGIGSYWQDNNTSPANAGSGYATPIFRVNVSSPTTVYLVAQGVFGSGTCTASGLIRARRVR